MPIVQANAHQRHPSFGGGAIVQRGDMAPRRWLGMGAEQGTRVQGKYSPYNRGNRKLKGTRFRQVPYRFGAS